MMNNFKRTTSEEPDFVRLVALLDADLAIRDGDEHAFYAQFNKTNLIRHVIVCYTDTYACGCGAFREQFPGKVEIKRMFVEPSFRGRGIASEILLNLEAWAKELGYETCILETGKNQPEAIALYLKSGYVITENYGQYVGVENSVCMEKSIVNSE